MIWMMFFSMHPRLELIQSWIQNCFNSIRIGNMNRGVARLGDRCFGTCYCHIVPISVGGSIETASDVVTANGRGVARLNDIVRADCGHTGIIVSASTLSSADGRGVARLGDVTQGCYESRIISASTDVTTV
jgi:uncharacterized Zn-binding protein involved in type VI secretion